MVPAEIAHVPFLDNVVLRAFIGDNPREGESSHSLEMLELASVLHESSQDSLVLMDELGRGTGIREGIPFRIIVNQLVGYEFGIYLIYVSTFKKHRVTQGQAASGICLPCLNTVYVQIQEGYGTHDHHSPCYLRLPFVPC